MTVTDTEKLSIRRAPLTAFYIVEKVKRRVLGGRVFPFSSTDKRPGAATRQTYGHTSHVNTAKMVRRCRAFSAQKSGRLPAPTGRNPPLTVDGHSNRQNCPHGPKFIAEQRDISRRKHSATPAILNLSAALTGGRLAALSCGDRHDRVCGWASSRLSPGASLGDVSNI